MWGVVGDEDWEESEWTWVSEEKEKSSSVLVLHVLKWILSNTETAYCNNVIIYIHKTQEKKDGLICTEKWKIPTHVYVQLSFTK